MTLSLINNLKNISFEKDDEKTESLISKLNFEVDKTQPKDNGRLDMLRDKLLSPLLNKYMIICQIILFLVILMINSELGGIYLTLTVMTYIFVLYYPKIKRENSYADLNQELPYALRHMAIELKSGKGLHDTFITIRNANYGSLSMEMNRLLEEIKFGKSTEDSLLEMGQRAKCEGLSRAIQQIIGTLRVGGNLSASLEIIAKDISFDMQIKLKEYSQKLNSFILIYTFIAILAPVISLIMLMAGSTVMGDIISSSMILVIYSLFFPLIVMFMGLFIKRLEPKI